MTTRAVPSPRSAPVWTQCRKGRALGFALGLALGAASAAAAGDPAAGQKVFALCASCHAVGPSARAGFGPQLNGVFGRRAGTDAGFKYSEAMAKSGIVWFEATLRAYLKDPGRVVPGTKMRFWGLAEEPKVTDLLAYLQTFPAP